MKLVDMKLPKRKKGKDGIRAMREPYNSGDKWPYGLQIRFETEQLKKLPSIENAHVGDMTNIVGVGKIISIRENDGELNTKSMEIQLEKVEVSPKKKLKDMGMKSYISARDKGQTE